MGHVIFTWSILFSSIGLLCTVLSTEESSSTVSRSNISTPTPPPYTSFRHHIEPDNDALRGRIAGLRIRIGLMRM